MSEYITTALRDPRTTRSDHPPPGPPAATSGSVDHKSQWAHALPKRM